MTTPRFIGILACIAFLAGWLPIVFNAIMGGQFKFASEFSAMVMAIVYLGPIVAVLYILKRLITK